MRRSAGPDDGAVSELQIASGRVPAGRGSGGQSGERGVTAARLSVEAAAAEAGVSVDTIRRAYRSGALRAFRPGGTRRIVILLEDMQAWAFGYEHLVLADGAGSRLRPVVKEPAVIAQRVGQHSCRAAAPGSVERLCDIERSG